MTHQAYKIRFVDGTVTDTASYFGSKLKELDQKIAESSREPFLVPSRYTYTSKIIRLDQFWMTCSKT